MIAPDSFRDQLPSPNTHRRSIVVLGSTGSIGRSTLEIVEAQPERFRVAGLVAHSNIELLSAQIHRYRPSWAVVTGAHRTNELRKLLADVGSPKVELFDGIDAVPPLMRKEPYDVAVAAIVGFAGLPGVLAALEAGRTVALANKESLVAGGALVRAALEVGKGRIIPVDSEHSALFQCMQGDRTADIKSLVLTASGGPFLRMPLEAFPTITAEQALQHPKWKMGPKVTIDSSTLINKGLELIEAHWLFDMPESRIEVVIHPQSIVHSLVRYVDGSLVAQLSVPDMKGPIGYALAYPTGRMERTMRQLDLVEAGPLEFFAVDPVRFPAIELARSCIRGGGNSGAVFNAANEAAVRLFLAGTISYLEIVRRVEQALERWTGAAASSLAELELLHRAVIDSVN